MCCLPTSKLVGGTLSIPILQVEKQTPRRQELARRPHIKSASLKAVLGSGPRTGKKYPKNAVLSQIRKDSISLTWAPINEIYATLLPFNPPLEHWGDLPTPGLLLHCCPLLSKGSPGAWASGVPQSSLPVLHVGPADPVSPKQPTLSIFLYPPPWPKARPTGCLGFLAGPLVASTAAQKNLCSHGNYRLF